ncbi:hypothetical protein [Trujillonella endophytica]|uniref:Uncharacterized protein n=1 Tax=Trujillonella endophytica TaxID=673521 RepID=A0A1H8SDL6_9ACTN|nr:hypothetical protein [Trujillella endophytica]SEO77149.1 hypothetical protein SAMN05660991_01651 [Trujillella endophytica]
MGKVSFALGLGVGYVLGARAGRSRFEQIQQAAVHLSERPQVQEAVGKVRESLPPTLQNAVGGLTRTSSAGGPSSGGSASGGSASGGSSNGPAPAGSYPLEDDEEVVAQSYSALRERSPGAPTTQDPGNTTGPVPVNAAPEDEEPVAQTHSAFTERSASAAPTEHDR